MSLQQLESNAVKIKRKVKRCITWLSKPSCLGENRKQPTFYDATSGSPAKWCLRNERRNSILMMHHYPDLVSASDCLKKISYAARSVESIACIADVKVVAGGGGECKKEEKSTPATKAASFALRPSFQLSQLSLQRPIRIRRTLFLQEWPHVGMYRQKRFRSCKTWENREIKIYVYAKRQTSDSSWEFLRIENKQIKTVKTILMYKTGLKLPIF